MNEEQRRDLDALYRAIGRFMVSFSCLVGRMERGITMIAGHRGGQEAMQAWHLGLAGIEANRIRVLFFGVAATAVELTDEEQRIHKALSKAVEKLIPIRNAFAHGEWYLTGSTGDGGFSFKGAALRYIQPHYLTGFVDKSDTYTAVQIETMCNEVDALRDRLGDFAVACSSVPQLPAPRVSELLELVDGNVRRRNI
jgi:hypothetical protein